jgi:hypothetical protein
VEDSEGQSWMRTYGGNVNIYANSCFEGYDKGFLFSGQKFTIEGHSYVWIMKTDINGNELWSKSFGDDITLYLRWSSLTGQFL